MSFLKFTNDVITGLLHADREPKETDSQSTPHETVVRLKERHFTSKIPTPGDKKVMKRCKVCHKKKIRRQESLPLRPVSRPSLDYA